jgi:hypothetical protein
MRRGDCKAARALVGDGQTKTDSFGPPSAAARDSDHDGGRDDRPACADLTRARRRLSAHGGGH